MTQHPGGDWVQREEAEDFLRKEIQDEQAYYLRQLTRAQLAAFGRWQALWIVGAFLSGLALGLAWVARCAQ
jgi:hypothetical protein